MRIDLNHGPQHARNQPQRARRAGWQLLCEPNALCGEDQAQLSGAHAKWQALVAQVSQLPEMREESVHALRQAMQSGHYRPNPEEVAGAMFAHMIAGPAA